MNTKHLFISIATTLGLLINLWWFQIPLVGIPLLAIFFVLLGKHIGTLLPHTITEFRHYWGILCAGSILIILSTLSYYVVGITTHSVSIIMLLLLSIYFYPKKPAPLSHLPVSRNSFSTQYILSTSLSVLIAVILMSTLIMNRTTGLLVSPWQTLEAWFFMLFALGIAASMLSSYYAKNALQQSSIISLYLFIWYSIAAILYVYGFGFDGFIHRATEEWIVQHGVIEPKTPYYIGQYSLIAFFALLTQLPVFILDTWLVPIASCLLLPRTIMYALKQTLPDWLAAVCSYSVPFLYFITLNLTTPHNLVLLLCVLTICSLFAYAQQRLPIAIPLALSVVALVMHPLLGLPLLLFSITWYLYQTKKLPTAVLIALYGGIVSLLPSAMFSFNNYLGGFGFPALINPFTKTDLFLSLFDRPYWYAQTSTPLFDMLYQYQRVIPLFIILLAIVGSYSKKIKTSPLFFWIGFVTFVIAAWFLRTWLFFPNVAAAEQDNYPLRLLWASVLFLLPLSCVGIFVIIKQIQTRFAGLTKQLFIRVAAAIGIGVVLTVSLYFSYPQRNPKVFFPGYNVTNNDITAVEWIHNKQGTDDNYIVLANSLTSIAALSKYSFAKHFMTEQGELFYYAIPTGGPLYGYYNKLVYEGQQRSDMQDALALTGADTGYFVMSSFWDNYTTIVAKAKESADEWVSLNNDHIHIFIYSRDTAPTVP